MIEFGIFRLIALKGDSEVRIAAQKNPVSELKVGSLEASSIPVIAFYRTFPPVDIISTGRKTCAQKGVEKMKAKARLRLIVAAAIFAVVSIWALPSAKMQSDDCKATNDPTVRLPATKLFIEHNSTAGDTGVHGLFDGVNWTRLCVFDPSGKLVLEVAPKKQLRLQSMSGIFFESAEPPNVEVPIAEILRRFPEGLYAVRGRAQDGRGLTGAATFTHDIPAAPVIVFPQDDAVLPPANLTVRWNHVTTTLGGRPLNRTGYEIILTKDVPDDPNGFSRPALSIHVPPFVTSLTVPNEFLEPGSRYEIEIIVLEVSGNQTLTSIFFKTQ